MKSYRFNCICVMAMLICGTLFCKAQEADYHTIPLPRSIQLSGKTPFLLSGGTQIAVKAGDAEMHRHAALLSEYLEEPLGARLTITEKAASRAIILSLDEAISDAEAYTLTVSDKKVTLKAGSYAGLFYGIQMLRKAVANAGSACGTVSLPAGKVSDCPRFAYRGMHLDCARHFFPVSFVKEFIDMLALHQMNTFHWHLTDDQGWRIEIKRYPRLTEVGSKRACTVVGRNSDIDDGIEYGGFYSQDDIREIVNYAAERHIQVIPEIDMPGHMLAALTAYPELGCTGGPYEVGTRWGVYRDVLCVGNERTMQFVRDVIDEVLLLFPTSPYYHIGGDESPRFRWHQCPHCQAKIAQLGLAPADGSTAEDLLQGWFTKQVEEYLLSKGRKMIGWDEVLSGGIDSTTTIMAWRGMRGGIAAAKAGHDVIMTPLTHCYFDYVQDTVDNYEPMSASIMPIPVSRVYTLDVPAELTPEEQRHIIGIQANIWTEYIATPNQVEYMAMPRMAALAECQWTPAEQKDYTGFLRRLHKLAELYSRLGYVYARHALNPQPVDRWSIDAGNSYSAK